MWQRTISFEACNAVTTPKLGSLLLHAVYELCSNSNARKETPLDLRRDLLGLHNCPGTRMQITRQYACPTQTSAAWAPQALCGSDSSLIYKLMQSGMLLLPWQQGLTEYRSGPRTSPKPRCLPKRGHHFRRSARV